MDDPIFQTDDTATQAQTQTETEGWNTGGWDVVSADLRVHGLTVLYHPDLERIGERAVLEGLGVEDLGAGHEEGLSRQIPEFAAPGSDLCRPLADRRLSRTPFLLRAGSGDSVVIDRNRSSTRLSVDGHELEDSTSVPAEALKGGVTLLLGGRIVLLLHLLDPVADTVTPRFGLVGDSPAMIRLRRDIVQIADLRVPILLRGESGTGKELVARAIHDAGPRQRRPYVAVNMAAMPPSLAAAELFGAERGAYTGADRRRAGYFEQAHGGTLFLDEVGETPLEVQALLLRTLETGEVQPVGGGQTVIPDARIVSATDADLESAIQDDRFRGPLLHRLSGYVLRLPPLRNRREDFGRLFLFFLRRELENLGQGHLLAPRPRPWLPGPLIARLATWHWPGNVRQLANVVRQLVIANRDSDPATRFDEIESLLSEERVTTQTARPPQKLRRQAAELSENEVIEALRSHDFRPAAAADALGIPRSSIYDLMNKIPGLRKASELSREQIEQARSRVGPSPEAMAADLEVSKRALLRRLGQLDS